jgi:hypothetical protein
MDPGVRDPNPAKLNKIGQIARVVVTMEEGYTIKNTLMD